MAVCCVGSLVVLVPFVTPVATVTDAVTDTGGGNGEGLMTQVEAGKSGITESNGVGMNVEEMGAGRGVGFVGTVGAIAVVVVDPLFFDSFGHIFALEVQDDAFGVVGAVGVGKVAKVEKEEKRGEDLGHCGWCVSFTF